MASTLVISALLLGHAQFELLPLGVLLGGRLGGHRFLQGGFESHLAQLEVLEDDAPPLHLGRPCRW